MRTTLYRIEMSNPQRNFIEERVIMPPAPDG